ncbi:uncharacterized protein LOC131944031 [Physella acuta]|uniref:uncharacterized protein LOC131944031 n=1 Tax=Physella acuta TaxID=109671 RepID=UPI0027DD8EEF|nr:uncharacterized protein LOC131944031 [Physella acuta]XP_059160473.1 uncharacterized protein LOC131944031 [Physella acuta]XP_059160483.1 uncharacterized protein LOC131944031 [Physella acuta]
MSSSGNIMDTSTPTTTTTIPINTTNTTVATNQSVSWVTHFITPAHSVQDNDTTGKIIAVVVTLIAVVAALVALYIYLRKNGTLDRLPCRKYTRTRRSSTCSSRRALDEPDVFETGHNPKPEGDVEEMFTIDDYEAQAQNEAKEEYFYDEVFGQSQFEDEATKKAMSQLYMARETAEEEEILDLDFETLGIKIDDSRFDVNRKNTI